MTGATVVIQARTGSTRLPGKVLQDIGGRPALLLMLERLRPLTDAGHTVVVATSDGAPDDPVAALAARAGCPVVRGPERDVLGRIVLALDEHPADDIVRLTADCPLHDPAVVQAVVHHHRRTGADYTSNTLTRTFPDGLDVEVLRAEVLRKAASEAVDLAEREHVTPFVYRRPSTFRLAQHACNDDAGDERWTIDTADDLDRLRRNVERLDDPVSPPWRQLLATFRRQAVRGNVRLRPVPMPDPDVPGPWVRRWDVGDGGTVTVTVDDGRGVAVIDVPAHLRQRVRALLDDALRADAQVRQLQEEP